MPGMVTFEDERQAPTGFAQPARLVADPGHVDLSLAGHAAAGGGRVVRVLCGTGQPRYRRLGLVILKWTVIAAVFFCR